MNRIGAKMSTLSPRQMFLLDEACKPITEIFGNSIFLVGSSLRNKKYSDVDIRLILDDNLYYELTQVVGIHFISFLGISIGEYLASRTGLPIDFQIQQETKSHIHEGHRNPLGLRTLENYSGD
jgi:hypothetical protein